MMRATRAITATVESVKVVLEILDIPFPFAIVGNAHTSSMVHAENQSYTRVFK